MQTLYFILHCKAKNYFRFLDHYWDILALMFNVGIASLYIVVYFEAKVQIRMDSIMDHIVEDGYFILLISIHRLNHC